MKKALFTLLLSLPVLAGADRSQAPVQDAVWLSRVTLNRLEIQEAVTKTAGLLPAKKEHLPLSVQLYLRPSGQLDALSGPIQKLAAKVRRAVAPGSKQKDMLRDSVAVAQEVWLQLEQELPVSAAGDAYGVTPSIDWRTAWPKASGIVKAGVADAQARVLVEVALLRALKVPARTAMAQGKPVTQYWVALAPEPAGAAPKVKPKPKTKAKAKAKAAKKGAPKPPLGYWALLDPTVLDEDVEAWSLDPGTLKRIYWQPEQELLVQAEAPQRHYFDAALSPVAQASYQASLELGRLTLTAGALTQTADALTDTAAASPARTPRAPGTYYVLSVDRYRLQVDGAMAPMTVDLLSPYRPQLASWQRELPSRVRTLETEAYGVWTDRPLRIRLKKNGQPQDEWQSPPPALGVLHFLSVYLRRPNSVLQAKVTDGVLQGVFLRSDNLTGRDDWDLLVTPRGVTTYSQVITVPPDGHFSLTLSAQSLSSGAFTLGSVAEPKGVYQGDSQILEVR